MKSATTALTKVCKETYERWVYVVRIPLLIILIRDRAGSFHDVP